MFNNRAEWLTKPALEWESASCEADQDNSLCVTSWKDALPASCVAGSDGEISSPESRKLSLSYLSVSVITASLCHRLRQVIQDQLKLRSAASNSNADSFSVVVFIAEGVLLPISISCVHVLNYPIDEHEFSVVLVPIDPRDAPKRIDHMLTISQPFLVLTSKDSDTHRLSCHFPNGVVQDVRKLLSPCCPQLKETQQSTIRDLCETIDNSSKLEWHAWIHAVEVALYRHDSSFSKMDSYLNGNISNRESHIVFTSGSTGVPKGCVSSIRSLMAYLSRKSLAHFVTSESKVLLASSISFDPCFSDVLATFTARATLILATRSHLMDRLLNIMQMFEVTHILCTPTLWSSLSSLQAVGPHDVPHLQVVALGGEPIPFSIVQRWARKSDQCSSQRLRLMATYGVTEACVYQSIGEVFQKGPKAKVSMGQYVGRMFEGLGVMICTEMNHSEIIVSSSSDNQGCQVGEIVLHGNQVDEYSAYLHQQDLSREKFFLDPSGRYCYRTGDRGYVDVESGCLFICGRIEGQDELLKINGIRLEVTEMETAIMDGNKDFAVVVDCIVSVLRRSNSDSGLYTTQDLIACIVLNSECLKQMNVLRSIPETGAICTDCPLLILLHERCRLNSRATPASFVIIPRIPQSSTGKRNRQSVPCFDKSVPLQSLMINDHGQSLIPLRQYSRTGALLSKLLVDQLHLLPVQETMLTSSATYATVGGDSLSATRIVRMLYAYHHGVQDSRHLGGKHGLLSEPFTVRELFTASNLGLYVDWLDSQGFRPFECILPETKVSGSLALRRDVTFDSPNANYNALFQATTLGHTCVAVGLLEIGADPNFAAHDGHFGKVKGRLTRMATFRSSPLHIACYRGDYVLVRELIKRNARFKTPDSSGLFPIHLIAAGSVSDDNCVASAGDLERLECMKALLQAGSPLLMKDGSKQTVLHCAARAGYCELLRYLIQQLQELVIVDPRKNDALNWRDNWGRTPVHWAVLNGKVDALAILLDMGSCANPKKRKTVARSSIDNESPTEICIRLYGSGETGKKIMALLDSHSHSHNCDNKTWS